MGKAHGSATVRTSRARRHVKGKGRDVDNKRAADLTAEEKWCIIAWCMRYYDGKKFFATTFTCAEKHFDGRMTARSMENLSADYLCRRKDGFISMAPKRLTNCGRPDKLTDLVKENIIDLHILTGGKLAVWRFAEQYEAEFGLRICRETMARYLKKMGATAARTYLAPTLSIKQRLERLKFIQGKLELVNQHSWRFKMPPNTVYLHSDEKWFYTDGGQLRDGVEATALGDHPEGAQDLQLQRDWKPSHSVPCFLEYAPAPCSVDVLPKQPKCHAEPPPEDGVFGRLRMPAVGVHDVQPPP